MEERDLYREYKRQAGERAVGFVESGMVVGLGFGSTALFAVQQLGKLVQSGKLKNIIGIPCSIETEQEARRLRIPLSDFENHLSIDLTIDGADEIDTNFNIIKGGGGAILREKIVSQASRRRVFIVDERKMSPCIGTNRALPVEVIPFGWKVVREYLSNLGATVTLRCNSDGGQFLTDQKNFILDCNFGPIFHPEALAGKLKQWPGIVEHGLFLGLATDIIVAGKQGIRHLQPPRSV